MKKIAFLNNASAKSGVGHHASELKKALHPLLQRNEIILDEVYFNGQNRFFKKTIPWIQQGLFFLAQQAARYNLVHATNQTLSFALPKKRPSIVTVHDIIELLEPQQNLSRIVARYMYSGIKRASHIISVSDYTKKTIQDYYNIPAEQITVIPNGLSSNFKQILDFKNTVGFQSLQRELKLLPQNKIILYVGSDHIRKNVLTALHAFAEVKKQLPEAIFLKVGEPGIPAGRALLLAEIDQLNLRESIHFIGSVSPERLNELYNLADVFIFPSRFEGFGLPPLQAMAAGTPVVASKATSLPEVIGEGGVLHDPEDTESFAKTMVKILTDAVYAEQLRYQGFQQAQKFSWLKAAQETLHVYQKLV